MNASLLDSRRNDRLRLLARCPGNSSQVLLPVALVKELDRKKPAVSGRRQIAKHLRKGQDSVSRINSMRIRLLELRRRRWCIVEMTNGNLDVFKKFDSAKSGAATVEVKGVNHDAGFGNFAEVYRSGFSRGYQDGYRVGDNERAG